MSTAIQRFGQGEGTVVPPDERINQTPIDRFTLLHVLAGVVGGVFGIPLPVVLVSAAWFEIAENVFQGSVPSIFPNTAPNDSLANAVCDVASVGAAWTVVRLLKG
jgi:hypothetical protein